MREQQAAGGRGRALLDIYDDALPEVYGYVLSRCGDVALAEDLTADTFLAAVDALRREERRVRAAADLAVEAEDPWDARLDVLHAREVLHQLGGHHRAALVLRYVDGLPVADVARHLGRTLHATEALLVRARAAFRAAYQASDDGREHTS